MPPDRVIVLLPCHTLDDFPTWLEEADADALLAAWTAAWHPAIIAAVGRTPGHASVDLPPPADAAAGIVPAFCQERFAAQAGAADAARWAMSAADIDADTRAIAGRLGIAADPPAGLPEDLPGGASAEDFRSLGLATLLAELLARRMRTEADLATTGFEAAVVAAARAAVAGDEPACRTGLAEAFACLEASRARYYSVESWVIDIVLLAPATLGAPLLEELRSPVPLALVATGETLDQLAERHPISLAAVREAVAEGRVEPCGGRADQRPLDACTPEAILDSFRRGRRAWQDHVGSEPSCYASIGGGSSAILPQLLAGFGCGSAIWSLFDGSSLPDPGAGRIRWEGTGGAAVEAVARPPLDAGRATSVLGLADRIGDALDHDHVAVVQFAHYAGAASRWHGLLRRIGGQTGLLGRFVTPGTLVDASAGGGTAASFEPDAFPGMPPPAADAADSLAAAIAPIAEDAVSIAAATARARTVIGSAGGLIGQPKPAPRSSARGRRWLPAGLFGGRRSDDTLLLDNGLVELRPHPRSGGLLSLRRPDDRVNRISQQLAFRTTGGPTGGRWEPPDERAEYGRMEADAITRTGPAAAGSIESRGRLLAADGRGVGRFVQRMSLVPDLPLAVVEVELELDEPVAGPFFEAHVACRFAWHENEDVELRRSLHLQSIATERTRFTAPHFVEIVPAGGRLAGEGTAVAILTGGLPWHLRTSPHVLDSVLLADGRSCRRRLAVGIGLERPWDAAATFASGGLPTGGGSLPANVRLAVEAAAGDPAGTLRASLIESAGRAGEVRIEWAGEVARAAAVDLAGRPLPEVHVTAAGRTTTVFLNRYQWLHLAIEFAAPGSPAPPGAAA